MSKHLKVREYVRILYREILRKKREQIAAIEYKKRKPIYDEYRKLFVLNQSTLLTTEQGKRFSELSRKISTFGSNKKPFDATVAVENSYEYSSEEIEKIIDELFK